MTTEWRLRGLLGSIAVVAFLAVPAWAAEDTGTQQSSWYIVGDRINGSAVGDDRLTADAFTRRVQLGLTYSNTSGTDILSVTAPSSVMVADETTGYSFLVSGAYDWRTSSIVTPRVMAGIGFSYLDQGRPNDRTAVAGSRDDVAPTLQLGLGADVEMSSSWDFTAEYRAFYRGSTELDGYLGESEMSQKFLLGAKIRF